MQDLDVVGRGVSQGAISGAGSYLQVSMVKIVFVNSALLEGTFVRRGVIVLVVSQGQGNRVGLMK